MGDHPGAAPSSRTGAASGVGLARLLERSDPGAVATLLALLPQWFGIPSANAAYRRDAETLPTLVAVDHRDEPIGVLLWKQHFAGAAEIHLMAVHPDHHRQGVGRLLVCELESRLRARGVRLLEVKTLGASRPSPEYAATRAFYCALGFQPVEELHGLWPGNPCLVMVKPLQDHPTTVDDRIDLSRQLYERAVFGGEADVLARADQELDAVEADLALARGRIMHARCFEQRDADPEELALFERAAQLYRSLGDVRGEGEAEFWIGCFHQVVRSDNAAAVPALDRSHELATQAGDRRTQSYALRHLGIAAHMAGRRDVARERLEESVRLRRELGFKAGVAANLVGLAYINAEEGRQEAARALLDEAEALAQAAGALGISRQVEEARTQLDTSR